MQVFHKTELERFVHTLMVWGSDSEHIIYECFVYFCRSIVLVNVIVELPGFMWNNSQPFICTAPEAIFAAHFRAASAFSAASSAS